MMQWNFYMSGILYGKFKIEKDRIFESMLDISTGKFTEFRAFTNDSFYKKLCSRSLLDIFHHLPVYEAVHKNPDREIYLPEISERYTKRADGSYFQRDIKFPKDLIFEKDMLYAIAMSGRDYGAVLVRKGFEDQTFLKEWQKLYSGKKCFEDEFSPGPVYPVHFAGTFMMHTRDGEELATDVYLPDDQKDRHPTVLIRTPYGKGDGKESYYRYIQRGYAVVIQDVRGREDSTGEWLPNYYEVEDGDDTLNWIAAQSWSDGCIGMTGGSYLGYVQWAAAASGNPHLKAMLSSVCAGSAFIDTPRRGGCFESGMMAWAFAMTEKRFRGDLMERDDWDDILDIRPLCEIAPLALGHRVPFLDRWFSHPDMDEFWKMSDWKNRYQGTPVPALIMSGWFDDNGMGTTEALDLTAGWPEETVKVILGPWKHSGNANYDIHDTFLGEKALRFDLDIICLKWLDHFLKNSNNGIEKTAPVEYYTIGENRWKTSKTWPVSNAHNQCFYLNIPEGKYAAGNGSSCGFGTIEMKKPETEKSETYIYDPKHPSIHIIDMSENEISVPENYTEEEKRADILTFTSPVLSKDMTVTGDITGEIYFSCDCPDTDLVLRLTKVDAAGCSVKLADGVLDVKYRNSFETPEYLEPGNIYKAVIRTTKISNTFKAGESMRITITSSAKNLIFPNSNTKNGFNSTEIRIANVTVYVGGDHSTCIYIPVEDGPCRF